MASDSEPRKIFEAPKVPSEVIFWGTKSFALQFKYIVTLANCNKAPIKKPSAHHNFRGESAPDSCTLSKQMFRGDHKVFQVGKEPSGLPEFDH